MATQTHILLLDDLSDHDVEADRTVQFSFDGTTYEIDLTDEHCDELQAALAPYIAAGRRVPASRPASRGQRGARSSRNDGTHDAKTVREWAQANGVPVNERGRISAGVLERYRAANG